MKWWNSKKAGYYNQIEPLIYCSICDCIGSKPWITYSLLIYQRLREHFIKLVPCWKGLSIHVSFLASFSAAVCFFNLRRFCIKEKFLIFLIWSVILEELLKLWFWYLALCFFLFHNRALYWSLQSLYLKLEQVTVSFSGRPTKIKMKIMENFYSVLILK